uniref:hypothetical protein n=1 Tax=Mediterraneibacter glycyrrhizinilyticus TaxID=342942 RepID=UPI000B02FA63
MAIYRYEELGENQMDVFREIGSIGNGNAITALSGILSEKISMELPEVNILEFNMAQNKIGDAEEIVGAVLVEMSGELSADDADLKKRFYQNNDQKSPFL